MKPASTDPIPPEDLLAHAGFVRGLARALVSGDADVDDVVQEAWLAALGSSVTRVRQPRSWLASIVRRRAARHHRTRASMDKRHAEGARPVEVPTPEDLAARREIIQRVSAAMAALPVPYHDVLVLRYYEDLPRGRSPAGWRSRWRPPGPGSGAGSSDSARSSTRSTRGNVPRGRCRWPACCPRERRPRASGRWLQADSPSWCWRWLESLSFRSSGKGTSPPGSRLRTPPSARRSLLSSSDDTNPRTSPVEVARTMPRQAPNRRPCRRRKQPRHRRTANRQRPPCSSACWTRTMGQSRGSKSWRGTPPPREDRGHARSAARTMTAWSGSWSPAGRSCFSRARTRSGTAERSSSCRGTGKRRSSAWSGGPPSRASS